MNRMRIAALILAALLTACVSAAADTLMIDAENPPPEAGSFTSAAEDISRPRGPEGTPVTYLDENGNEQVCSDYKTESSNHSSTTHFLKSGWYVFGDCDIGTMHFTVENDADVHLILKDNTTLAGAGIELNTNASLTIYSQSVGATQMGALQLSGGLGSSNPTGTKLTVNGGKIDINIEAYSAIGAKEEVSINGGVIHAAGPIGINTSMLNLNLNDKNRDTMELTVTATGSEITSRPYQCTTINLKAFKIEGVTYIAESTDLKNKETVNGKTLKPAYITVSFEAGGGSGSMAPVYFPKERGAESTETKPYILPACGFTPPAGTAFAGWKKGNSVYQPGNPYVFYTSESGATFVAQWVKNDDTYALITFDPNGGYGTMDPVTVKKGESYTLPESAFKAPANKIFDKWDKGAPGQSIQVNDDITITAQWVEGYTVTFDPQNGESTFTQDVKQGEHASLPAVPTKQDLSGNHASFTGWYKEAACNSKYDFNSETVTESFTLYGG